MGAVKLGDLVRVHYIGTTEGEQFDSSYERGEPLEFTVGTRQVVAGFENGVLGMTLGEIKTINVPFSLAYGPHNPDMVIEEKLAALPPGAEVGATLVGRDESGQQLRFRVMELRGDTVVLDANHPLSGKRLTFRLELMEIVEESEE